MDIYSGLAQRWTGALMDWWTVALVGWWIGGLVDCCTGGLVDWCTGGLVDWLSGGLVHWWIGGLLHWWIVALVDWRNAILRHLRVEQFTRYLCMAGETAPVFNGVDDTVELDDGAGTVDTAHRNYDELMEATPQGAHFLANFKHVPGVRRRRQSSLGVSRVPFIEPIGNSREDFFEAKLVLGLPWYCPTLPEVVHREDGSKCTEYSFRCDAPEQLGGQQLDPLVLKLGREHVCYEVLCERLERRFCAPGR